MGASGERCAKALLIVVNILFQLVGFILFIVGMVLKFGWDLISDYVVPMLGDTDAASGDAASSLSDNLVDILAIAAYLFIGLGGFMAVVGCLGCCGACCKIKTLLIVYTSLVLLVFLAKLIFIVLMASATLDDQLKTSLVTVLEEKYGGITDFSVESLAFNILMIQYECCGINNYHDFDDAVNWDPNITAEIDGTEKTITLVAPLACCKMDGTFPAVEPLDFNCTEDPTDDNSNFNTGCWGALKKEIQTYAEIMIGAYSGVLVLEVICAAVAIYLIRNISKEESDGKVNPMLDDYDRATPRPVKEF